MKHIKPILIALFCLLIGQAEVFAHAKTGETFPKDGAELTEQPAEIKLTFSKPVRLTKVTLTKANSDKSLQLKGEARFQTAQVLPLDETSLDAGTYTVTWRALAKDGHPMKGYFSFTIMDEQSE